MDTPIPRSKTVKTVWFYSPSGEPRLKPWLMAEGGDIWIACQPLAGGGDKNVNYRPIKGDRFITAWNVHQHREYIALVSKIK